MRILPPLMLLERVGVIGNSFSCFLKERLSLRLCPEDDGEVATSAGKALSTLVGDERGVADAIVPSTPALEADLSECVAGMFLAATAIAGLCGEVIAITKGIPVLEVPLTWRSGRGDVG